jgi:hypothetical protein
MHDFAINPRGCTDKLGHDIQERDLELGHNACTQRA